MKRLSSLLLLFVFVSLVACGGNAATPTDSNDTGSSESTAGTATEAVSVPDNYQSYANEGTGISLRYPSDWVVLDDSGNAITLGSHSELSAGNLPEEPYAIFAVNVTGRGMSNVPEDASAEDLQAYLEGRFDSFGLSADDITESPQTATIGGRPAATGTLLLERGSPNEVANRFAVFLENDRLVTTVSVAPTIAADQFAEAFANLNSSVSVAAVDLNLVEGVTTSTDLDRAHDSDVAYENTGLPPVGGVHDPVWQNCGIYAEPVESRHAVHSLEHGAVWITYQPELDEESVAQLRDETRGESHVLLSPFPDQQSPVVLTAWGVQLELDSAFDERVADFIERYQNGPQTPEPGAACRGGTGTPVE